MQTFTRIGIAALLTALVALSGCEKKTTSVAVHDRLSLNYTGIGINGHVDKLTGQWIPAWAYVTDAGDTVGYWNTEIEATTWGQLAKGLPPVVELPPPQSWNFLLTYIGPGEILTASMPDPSPPPADSLYWLSVYQDSTGYVWVAVSPLPSNP
jgi:hypothetical protein